jgi:hypothetical protein
MQKLLAALMTGMVLLPAPAIPQDPVANIRGYSKGCSAGKVYRPGRVEIYIFDAGTSPEVPKLLHQMDDYQSLGESQNEPKFFDSYNHLLHLVRVSKALGNMRSDQSRAFNFGSLPTGLHAIIVGISPMEDDPAFYAYTELAALEAGENTVTLDFARGDACKGSK